MGIIVMDMMIWFVLYNVIVKVIMVIILVFFEDRNVSYFDFFCLKKLKLIFVDVI